MKISPYLCHVEILEFLPDKQALKNRESEIVNEDLIANELCMNIQLGGGGGFISDEHALKARISGGKKSIGIIREIHFERLRTNLEYHQRWLKSRSESTSGENNGFFGKKHTEETIKHLSDVRRGKGCGENNSQFGTCWIYHEAFGSKKIKKEDLFSYIDQGWIKGRKKNNLVD